MAPLNTKNVHRSNALLGHAYGSDFVYEERMCCGSGRYEVVFSGTGPGGRRFSVRVKGDLEPGYDSTSKLGSR